ncbi:hypothetical protein [Mucilaginibacter glaciei]|uniref:Uncharacterized protein n=1 Tax=Mucilaginibacter glaciei TaxID=2772109 RepID=A0A926S0H3_9SPHI|nr:hypothetical protein [Mucilaginibacter glaciei]MBD1392950.1 hypothetical protein [Mucilaginibacter glaciei]
MKTNFQTSLHIKTPSGFEIYGNFDLGSDRERAMAIVEQFKLVKLPIYVSFEDLPNNLIPSIRYQDTLLDK